MDFRKFFCAVSAVVGLTGCSESEVLYQSEQYTVFSDKVVQGPYQAKALDRTHIVSDYISPARTQYSSTLSFKFSINGKDNEASSGQDHALTIVPQSGEYVSPVISFGAKDPASYIQPDAPSTLPANTKFTVRVDMNAVLKQFQEEDYYTTFDGDQIRQQDFKGVYIAGGSAPLSWDFDNLHTNPSYLLEDSDADGIYEGTFILNPHDPEAPAEEQWTLQNDISAYPSYSSDQLLVDALYNMALDEMIYNIEEDSTFRTGKEWSGVWTRDISYSILLAFAYIEPTIAKISLMKKVDELDRIIQDTGSGGAWPVSSDRVVWALAAWEVYVVTGDMEWLEQAYGVISNTLTDDFQTVYDETTGLFKGESSFLDWREQTYPHWMDNVDISQSLNLGTNVVYSRALEILSMMAAELGEEVAGMQYAEKAELVRTAINDHLWNDEKDYYNQYLYGRYYMNVSPRSEALGEALSVLYGVASPERIQQVVANTPVMSFGIPCIYPQIPNVPPYHNNGIWPFVQGYWNWAIKEAGNEQALLHGLASIYRPAALFTTNKENFVAENGDYADTQINSDRMLWSMAGNLAMVYRVFLGMSFQPDKLLFQPFIPRAYGGVKHVNGFRYRDATLDIEVRGYGDGIKRLIVDGVEKQEMEISAGYKGHHQVIIEMNNKLPQSQPYNIDQNEVSPSEPLVRLENDVLRWGKVKGAYRYLVFFNGRELSQTNDTTYILPDGGYGQYKVMAINEQGVSSFTSVPVTYYNQEVKVEMEGFVAKDDASLVNYSGSGFIRISKESNTKLKIPITLQQGGKYLIRFRYANGNGPWNTDNKCAIRTLFVDGQKSGSIVMPQRGMGEWSNWGMTNEVEAYLTAGTHELLLAFQPSDENMNLKVNEAVLDYVQLTQVR